MNRGLAMIRWVLLCVIASLLWKLDYFRLSHRIYVEYPLVDDFFPAVLRNAGVLAGSYVLTIAAMIAVVLGTVKVRKIGITLAMTLCTVLVLHQGSHNDMTFATAWWATLWTTWMVFAQAKSAAQVETRQVDTGQVDTGQVDTGQVDTGQVDTGQGRADDAVLLWRAALLSRMICSLILLGGAVGKWTAEYWSGEVLYEIYFVGRDFWLFNALRDALDPTELVDVAKWYSRKVIVVETLAGFGLWLLPPRHAAAIGVLIFASIVLFSNFMLFSVLLSMLGLASVGWFIKR